METRQVKARQMWQRQFQANRRVEAKQPPHAAALQRELSWGKLEQKESGSVSRLENQRLVLRPVEQSGARELFLPLAKLKEMQHQLEEGSAVLQAPARRCWQCLGPCAFSQQTLAARKCNRAARCGGYPNPVQYQLPRNRRVLAGCGNRYNRWQRKHARRVRTFLIAAADKYLCLPHRTAH
jgi:hypothetical protein